MKDSTKCKTLSYRRAGTAALKMTVAAAAVVLTTWVPGWFAQAAFGDEAPPLTAVEDLRHVFTLSVPATWQTTVAKGDTAVSTKSPPTGDTPPDSVEVVVRDTIFGVTDAKSCMEKVKWVMRSWLHKQFTTLSEGPMTIGGLPSYGHTYTWTTSTGAQRWSTQACVVQRGRVYVLTGTTVYAPPAAPAHADLIMAIMNSFHFTGNALQ